MLVVVLIFLMIMLYVRGEKKLLNYILYVGITEAEKQYGGKTGQLKKAAVITKIYSVLPVILKFILTEKRISQLIENALIYAKTKWAENAGINNYLKGAPVEDDDAKPP